MRITFLLPFIKHRGGTQLVMDLSDRLARGGDDVTVVFPTRLKPLPAPLNAVEWLWRAPAKLLGERWFSTRAQVLPVPTLAEHWIPRADVVVATQWRTAEFAHAYGPERGRKVYWIFEPETHHEPEACADTYRMRFDLRLAISDWTREQLAVRFGAQVDAVTPLGLDGASYPARREPPRGAVRRIGMLYDPSPKKGFADGYSAFLAAQARYPRLELHLLGVPRSAPPMPHFVVPHYHATHAQKIALMHDVDVWIASSREDGWGLAPMEAMACGAAVITTRVGGTPYFAFGGRTALVVEPGDRAALASALDRLLVDRGLRHRLVEEGVRTARALTLDRTASLFRRALDPLCEEVAREAASGIALSRS